VKASAHAKLNLALVVGPRQAGGRHDLATVMEPLALTDDITLDGGDTLSIDGFAGDTLVRRALELLADTARVEPRWHVTIEKAIPVAGGLGGGSSDAAAALRLANETLERPLAEETLHALAATLGADVPFFLVRGPKLGHGDGTQLRLLDLPRDHTVLLLLPDGAAKASTGAVYDAFDARDGAAGYQERRSALLEALERVRTSADLAALPPNDLASSPLAAELREAGAFRADVTGAGPTVYGLFHDRRSAERAATNVRGRGRVWITEPAW
jgi:4-diphosphocytidyl-2-C-methyl-D-erythritol kinase